MYRVLIAAWRPDENFAIGELPLEPGWSYGKGLNEAGDFSGNISFDVPQIGLIEPKRTLVLVERFGKLKWAGWVWDVTPNSDKRTYELKCAGMWSYWKRRTLDFTYNASPDDPNGPWDVWQLVTDILALSTTQTGGDVGLIIDRGERVGKLTTAVYAGWERHLYADIVEELANADDTGFDFDIDTSWVGGNRFEHRWQMWENRGAELDLVLEWGRNVAEYDAPMMGSAGANDVSALGSGEGITAVIVQVVSKEVTEGREPRLSTTVDMKNTYDATLLTNAAALELRARAEDRQDVKLRGVEVGGDTHGMTPMLPGETLDLGDWVRVRVDDGPVQLDHKCRVMDWTVTVDGPDLVEHVEVGVIPWEKA